LRFSRDQPASHDEHEKAEPSHPFKHFSIPPNEQIRNITRLRKSNLSLYQRRPDLFVRFSRLYIPVSPRPASGRGVGGEGCPLSISLIRC
jgi:hypothetical protein